MTQQIGRLVIAWVLVAGGVLAAACGSPDNSGDGGNGGTSVPSAELCAAQFDAMEKACPSGNAKDASVEICKGDQREYAGIGCQDEYDAWLQCTAGSAYHCADDMDCEVPQAGYFMCQSQAVQRTGCVRLSPQDTTRCSDSAEPYAFGCLARAPASCVQVVTEGAGIWCCPQL